MELPISTTLLSLPMDGSSSSTISARSGEIDFDEPKAALCKPIREKVHQSLSGDGPHKGSRDGAILKWIRPFFDADKTAHDDQKQRHKLRHKL